MEHKKYHFISKLSTKKVKIVAIESNYSVAIYISERFNQQRFQQNILLFSVSYNNQMYQVKKAISRSILNFRGWKTNRKIVVIESDDWGSIRMPSKEVYNKCLKAGYRVDKSPFFQNDCLESNDDIELLFDILLTFKDATGNHPIITANVLMANPNFERIREARYEEYIYETVQETFKRYPKHDRVIDFWKKGAQIDIFRPQLHGREHLNVSRFMKDLRSNNVDLKFAFENKILGFFNKGAEPRQNVYVRGMEFYDSGDLFEKVNNVVEGANLFKSLFGYYSQSFIAQNYIWNSVLEKELHKVEVKHIQSGFVQKVPIGKYSGFRNVLHYTGQKNKHSQIYTIRNSYFEPSIFPYRDNFKECLSQINYAFMWKKPAIICMHRINFSGFINKNNRDKNLKLFSNLLREIIKKWPDVEFMSSEKLGTIILNS